MRTFHNFFFLICTVALLTSCFSSQLVTEKPINQSTSQSKFASGESVGMHRDDVIKNFGSPISTSIDNQKNGKFEDLHYLELLGDIKLITIITLKDGVVVKQKVDQITSNYDDRLNKIEKNLKILQSPRLYN